MDEQPTPVPSLPTYATSHHFLDRKQQAPLIKVMSKMLKPKFHRLIKNQLKWKKKHQVKFY